MAFFQCKYAFSYENMTFISIKEEEQAGAELGQAQLKLELELCFTSFEICCIKLVRLYQLSGPIPSKSDFKWLRYCQKY